MTVFAVLILAVPTVMGGIIAFFLTWQQSENRRRWNVGYILYTLLYAIVSYYLFFSRVPRGCDFSVLVIPFLIPSWLLSMLLCHVGGKNYREERKRRGQR